MGEDSVRSRSEVRGCVGSWERQDVDVITECIVSGVCQDTWGFIEGLIYPEKAQASRLDKRWNDNE